MNISDIYWLALVVELFIFWGLDSYLIHFHQKKQNLKHGMNNILLWGFSALTDLLLARSAAYIIYWAETSEWGILYYFNVPYIVQLLLGFLWIDVANYSSHYLKHRWHWLWSFHLVHHNDHQLDATSTLRHHPGEAAFSWFFLTISMLILGIPSLAILLFYLAVNPLLFLQHSNIKIPERLDRFFAFIINTPNLHKVHHLENHQLSSSNYGYLLSIWDRLFGTYQAPLTHMEWKFGVTNYSEAETSELLDLLTAPMQYKKEKGTS